MNKREEIFDDDDILIEMTDDEGNVFYCIDKLIKKLKASEKGQGMVEYAIVLAAVVAIAVAAARTTKLSL